jgi:hypothetical protein
MFSGLEGANNFLRMDNVGLSEGELRVGVVDDLIFGIIDFYP